MNMKQLEKLVSQLVNAQIKAQAKAQPKAKAVAKPKGLTKDEKKAVLEAAVKAAFEAKGFTDVQPRVTVLTAKKWAEQGKTVKPGSEPVWVKAPWMTPKQMGYPMFHVSQLV